MNAGMCSLVDCARAAHLPAQRSALVKASCIWYACVPYAHMQTHADNEDGSSVFFLP